MRTNPPDARAAKITVIAGRVTELPAAAQHDFPKPDIEYRHIDRNWNRPFAAPLTDVSYVENLAVG